MKQQLSIEQQVAQLTEDQKKTIRKIGFYCTIFGVVPAIAGAALSMAVMLWTILAKVDSFSGVTQVCMIACLCAFAWCIGLVIFIKVKFPFYSDAKLKYLKKHP